MIPRRFRLAVLPWGRTALPSALVGALGLLSPIGAQGTSIVLFDDDVLVDRSDLIVIGRVESVDPLAGTDRPSTVSGVRIDRSFGRTSPPGSLVEVEVGVGILPGGLELQLDGAPRFEPGEEVLLFLRQASSHRFRIVGFLQGAFHVVQRGGVRFAVRDLEEVTIFGHDGSRSQTDSVRELDPFLEWLQGRAEGRAPRSRREPDRPAASPRYSLITQGGLPVRWRTFDSGETETWRAHSGGQPGLPGGGFAEIEIAAQAWNDDPTTPISFVSDGTVDGDPGGLSIPDGHNTILFGDPNANPNFDGPFSCASGGMLAIGGPWVSTGTSHAQPYTGVAHREIVEADVVTNAGIDCWIGPDGRAEELFAHELGHTLGLGHSSVPDALMRSVAYGDGRGAAITLDDRYGICSLYCLTAAGPADLLFADGFESGDPSGWTAPIR